MLRRLWDDENASATPEWAMLVTILVLGAITGVVLSKHLDPLERDAMLQEPVSARVSK